MDSNHAGALGGMYSNNSQQVITDVLLQDIFYLDQFETALTKAELHGFLRKNIVTVMFRTLLCLTNYALLAKLVSLNNDERSILEFAVSDKV